MPTPATACVARALRASPRYAQVRPFDVAEGLGFRLAVHDSALGWRDVTLRVEAADRPDTASAVTVEFVWLGGARRAPLDDQRHLVTLATDVLVGLRAACVPHAHPAVVECFARGRGGAPACRSAS